MRARAVVLVCCRPKLNKASAFTADAVLQAFARLADIKPLRVDLRRRSDILRHHFDELADFFIQSLWVDVQKKTPLADGLALDQHSSIATTEQAGSLMASFSPFSVTPS